MGIKNIFKKKDPTEKELVEDLQRVGISTRTAKGREEKFGAFRQYANERQSQRAGLKPVNPYAAVSDNSYNPYAALSDGANCGDNDSSIDTSVKSPYDRALGHSSAAYDELPKNAHELRKYSSQNSPQGMNAMETARGSAKNNPYSSTTQRSAPGSESNRTRADQHAGKQIHLGSYSHSKVLERINGDANLILDLNEIPTDAPPLKMPVRKTPRKDLDLNDLPDEDLNVDAGEFLSEQAQVNSEDEEIEAIKQDIRFTKQESVALTRNTLRMAQEAEASGTNTLGMLGSQSERLYNAEQNLLLADTQTKIADEKVRELSRLNRSIFIPATGNPFNKKSRLRQQELKLKTEKAQEKYLRDTNRKGMYASEQRLTQGITDKATSSELFSKYQGEKQILQAERYQFENDSEDDEMEKELASNLDTISKYSKKLRSTAQIMGQEVDAQNDRLRRIEEDADRLDINVHLNSSRLNNIR